MLLKAFVNPRLGAAREMDRLFDSMMSSQPFGFVPAIGAQSAYPAVNLWEDPATLYAEAELPGMTMDDIEVLVTEDQLTVKGTRAIEVPEDARALRRERLTGSFERTVDLPVAIDPERAEARLVNGVLSITLPKVPQPRPRRIEVKAPSDAS